MASIISLNDEIANQRKCEKIIRMLDHRLIKNDFAFKDLCFSLINNSSNLDKILADINLYLQSKTVLKAETINFVADNVCSWGACSSILLTVKYDMSDAAVTAAFKRFHCLLSGDVFGKSYKRYGKRCKYFAVQEGSFESSIRSHYHCIFKLPEHLDQDQFKLEVNRVWTHGKVFYKPAHNLTNLKPLLVRYLCKSRTKITDYDYLEYFHF